MGKEMAAESTTRDKRGQSTCALLHRRNGSWWLALAVSGLIVARLSHPSLSQEANRHSGQMHGGRGGVLVATLWQGVAVPQVANPQAKEPNSTEKGLPTSYEMQAWPESAFNRDTEFRIAWPWTMGRTASVSAEVNATENEATEIPEQAAPEMTASRYPSTDAESQDVLPRSLPEQVHPGAWPGQSPDGYQPCCGFVVFVGVLMLVLKYWAARRYSRCDICEIEYGTRATKHTVVLDGEKLTVCSRCRRRIENRKASAKLNEFLNARGDGRERQIDINTNGRRPIPSDVKRKVWRRDQGRCVGCGSNEALEFDHIIPVSKGGSNTVRNIQLLCERCNRAKAANIE